MILFLYSVVLTRGIDIVAIDQGVEQEPLISMPFGHAKFVAIA